MLALSVTLRIRAFRGTTFEAVSNLKIPLVFVTGGGASGPELGVVRTWLLPSRNEGVTRAASGWLSNVPSVPRR